MPYRIGGASLFDFFNNSPKSSVGQEFPTHNFEAENWRPWGWAATKIVFEALVEDHVPHKAGAVGVWHPWYRMLKI